MSWGLQGLGLPRNPGQYKGTLLCPCMLVRERKLWTVPNGPCPSGWAGTASGTAEKLRNTGRPPVWLLQKEARQSPAGTGMLGHGLVPVARPPGWGPGEVWLGRVCDALGRAQGCS